MLLLISSILFIYYETASCAPPAGRSASALNDICQRFPWLNPCQVQQQPVENDFQKTLPPNEDFCGKYNSKFDSYCSNAPTDNVIKDFCKMYKAKCGTVRKNVQPTMPTPEYHFEPLPPPVLNLHDLTQYCLKFKNDYAHHCVNREIDNDAGQFCYGYSKMCPGSPEPGAVYMPNVNGQGSYNEENIKRIREQIERVANSVPVEVQPEKPKDAIDWSLYSAP